MGDRDGRTVRIPHDLNMSIKLFSECPDEDHAQSMSRLMEIQPALRYPNPIVGNCKSPARFNRHIGNDK